MLRRGSSHNLGRAGALALLVLLCPAGCGFLVSRCDRPSDRGYQDGAQLEDAGPPADAGADDGAAGRDRAAAADAGAADGAALPDVCSAGTCVDSGPQGDAASLDVDGVDSAPDASPGDAAASDRSSADALRPACGTVAEIQDTFDDGPIDPQWSTFGSSMVKIDEDALVITPPATTNPDSYGGLEATAAASLRNSAVRVEVLQSASLQEGAEACLFCDRGVDNALTLCQSGTGIVPAKTENGDRTWDWIDFDDEQMRWWQIREQGGIVYFETSADGTGWDLRWQTSAPPYADYCLSGVSAGTYRLVAQPQPVKLDDFNAGMARGGWCPAAQLTDDFDASSLGWAWEMDHNWLNNCQVDVLGGELVVWEYGNQAYYCGAVTASRYDLDGSSVRVELTQPPGDADAFAGLVIWVPPDFTVFLGVKDGWTHAVINRTGAQLFADTAVAPEPVKLLVTGSGTQLAFYYRSNHADAIWQQLGSHDLEASLAAVRVGLILNFWGGNFDGMPFSLEARFDDYNL